MALSIPSLNTVPSPLTRHISSFLTPDDNRRLKTTCLPVHNRLPPIPPLPRAHSPSAPTHMLSTPPNIESIKNWTGALRLMLLPHTIAEKGTIIFGGLSSLLFQLPLLGKLLFLPLYARMIVVPSGSAKNKIHMFALSVLTIIGYTYAAHTVYTNTHSFFFKGLALGVQSTVLNLYGAGTIHGGMLGFFHLKGTLQNLVIGNAAKKYPLVFRKRDQNIPSRLHTRFPNYMPMEKIIRKKSDIAFDATYFISNIAITILTGNPILACGASETLGCLAKVITMKLLAEKHQYDWIH